MAILHYTYLVQKMPIPCGVISIRGDIKRAYDCNMKSCEMAGNLTASTELQELKESLAEPPPPGPVLPNSKTSKMSIQSEDALSK
jgi:hypothetical protein